MARKICSTENCKNPASKIAGENPDYCSSCFEQAGYENDHYDGGHADGELPDLCPLCGAGFVEETQVPEGGPEPDPEYIAAVHESKPLTRKQCMEALKELGYVGPTSYLMPKVRAILAEVEAAAS